MEIEFDKEIDAILRKARVGTDAPPTGKHLDADAIAAFAENALPAKVKALYTAHFADCGWCRASLSHVIAWPPAEPKAAGIAAPAAESSSSWISSWFTPRNLTLAMGGLVLLFAGVLGFLAIRNSRTDSNATIAQVDQNEEPRGAPYASGLGSNSSNTAPTATNTSSTPDASANKAASNSAVTGTGAGPGTLGRGPSSPTGETTVVTGDPAAPVAVAEQPAGAAPPPPATSERDPKTGEKSADENKAKNEDARNRESRMQYDGMSRDAKKVSGPTRSAGPRLNQQNVNSDLQMSQSATGRAAAATRSGIRSAGGKKFESRGGAWYDTSYRGQATNNVARGSEEFDKLDDGLRSIARSIGGVVVVVWKGTAYRIQ